jgi:hypothetical protein
MSNSECLGLPACGKSWVMENKLRNRGYRCISISSLNKIFKGCVGVVGLILYFRVIPKFYAIYYANDSITSKMVVFKTLILFSRLGILKFFKLSVVDEGPLQALWGTIWKMELNDTNLLLVSEIVDLITKGQTIIYIMSKKNEYKRRVALRARKHPFSIANEIDVRSGRMWLALILKLARKNAPVVLIKN